MMNTPTYYTSLRIRMYSTLVCMGLGGLPAGHLCRAWLLSFFFFLSSLLPGAQFLWLIPLCLA